MQRLQKVPTQSSKSPPGTDDSNSPCLKSGTRSQSRVLQSKTSGLKILAATWEKGDSRNGPCELNWRSVCV